MKKAKILIPLMISFVLILAVASYAQQPTKIAIVNSMVAFQNSIEGKKATQQMQERDTNVKGNIQKLDDAIRVMENRLTTGRLTMTQEALMSLQADIDKKTTERKRYEEDATRDFTQFRDNLIQRIRDEMVTIIKALRKEKGYDLVLDLTTSGIVDFDPTTDITEEVVKRYDAAKAAVPPVKK